MIQMYINGEEVVCDKEIEITEELLATSSTILKNCYPKSWETNHDYTGNFYFPEDYSRCLIYKDEDLIFCGVVKNTGNISLNPRDPHYCDLQILDFKTMLSEGECLDFVISGKTIQEAIEMVVDAIKDYGFQVGDIELSSASDPMGTYSTLDKTAYDVFQYIADITQSKWFTRMIDDDKVAIDFYDPDSLNEVDNLEYTREYWEQNNIQDISFSYSTQDYRNKQIMLSDQVYANIDSQETFYSDGYNTQYTTTYNVGTLKVAKINGATVTIATMEDKQIGILAGVYYTPGSNIIETEENYSSGTRIDITYTPLVKGRIIVNNVDEINRINLNTERKGTITRYENRNDATTTDELNNIGQSYIQYKGKAEILLNIITYNKDLYNIADIVYFDAPINDLKLKYMVKRKIINIIATTGDIFYTYELSSSYNSERAINYFDNQRAKAKGNISAGEYITRNIDIENEANIIFNNLSIEEVDEGNILNCALNSPLNN